MSYISFLFVSFPRSALYFSPIVSSTSCTHTNFILIPRCFLESFYFFDIFLLLSSRICIQPSPKARLPTFNPFKVSHDLGLILDCTSLQDFIGRITYHGMTQYSRHLCMFVYYLAPFAVLRRMSPQYT